MAAEAIVSVVLQQLTTSVIEEIQKGVGAGAGRAVENLTSKFQSIKAVLMDAEEKQMKNNGVRVWLDKLKKAAYDIDDVLDEWNTKMMKLQTERVGNASTLKKKVCFFFLSPGYCFRRAILSYEIAFKIKEMNERLDGIAREKDMFNLNVAHSESVHKPREPVRSTSSFVDVSHIYGRDEEKRTLVSMLLSECHEEGKGLHTISIVGMGGMGKTTLAQFAYNDPEIVNNFEKRMWVCVSDPFDEFRIAKAILEALTGDASNLGELQAAFVRIAESIVGKKFLLVLDDVWTEDYNIWEPLYNCLKTALCGSKILVTTRKDTVAHMVSSDDNIISIKEVSEEACWSLFISLAFLDRSLEECEKFEDVGRKIVGKCKGLPLAIKSIGSLLRFKKTSEEWEMILDSELWNLEEFKRNLVPALSLSYNDLPHMMKRCFSYCAVFPKDYYIKKDELIRLWMAQGYLGVDQNKKMEVKGKDYFNCLVTRSFFQDFAKDGYDNITRCKMHDIVHDFAQSVTDNECFALEIVDSNVSTTLCPKTRHLVVRLDRDAGASFSLSLVPAKNLRSLVIIRELCLFCLSENVQDKLFDKLACIRTLGLVENHNIFRSGNEVRSISRKIGKLIHLRYLNLSDCRFLNELPETLCELYNLQTLDITWCEHLKKLPEGMGKLVNLRHLLNSYTLQLIYMPKVMERLTCLRTLKSFVVSADALGSTLDCLKNLNNLQGSLSIRRLRNVMNVDEAKKTPVLENKKYLTDLTLNFESDRVYLRDEDVLECLQPTSNIEKLEIQLYRGKTLFPNWNMMLLTKLRELNLGECSDVVRMPPLGRLSSLESLYIRRMSNIKLLSNDFLGIENDPTTPSSSSVVAFPKLKSLTFDVMEEWEEWDYKIPNREEEEKDDFPRIMPCLSSLEILYCSKLKELPDYLFQITTLQNLRILFSTILEERFRKENGDYWKNIKHIKNIKIGVRVVKRAGVEI